MEIKSWLVKVSAIATIITLFVPKILLSASFAESPVPIEATQSQQVEPTAQRPIERPLRLSVTVSDPENLKVKIGDVVKVGDVLVDKTQERSRLTIQKKMIALQIERLQEREIIPPRPLRKLLPLRPLPPANYAEELAAISHAKLRLQQAKIVLKHRTPRLEKVDDFAYQEAQTEAEQQLKLVQEMQTIQAQPEVIQHESLVMQKMQRQVAKAQADMEEVKDKQTQELEQLKLNVQLAESELQQKEAALVAAHSRRKSQEFAVSLEAGKRDQQEEEIAIEHERQILLYDQQQREKNYQISELNIREQQIDDKLADLPIVHSPKSGYIKRIGPWIGKDGKYTTRLVIANFAHSHSLPQLSSSSSISNSQRETFQTDDFSSNSSSSNSSSSDSETNTDTNSETNSN